MNTSNSRWCDQFYIFDRFVKNIKLIASPTIRCIQTIVEFAKVFEIDEVTIDNGFIEMMKPPYLDLEFDELEIRGKQYDKINEEYFENKLPWKFNDLNNDIKDLNQRKPEGFDKAKQRMTEYWK